MRDETSGLLTVGDRVTVSEGLYAGIDGEVMEVVHTIRPWVGRARLRLSCPHPEYWHPFWSDPMDEAEWQTTGDTAAMERYLKQLDPPGALRKWRLFAAACVRRVWDKLPDARSRRAILISERYADGEATLDEVNRVIDADYAPLEQYDDDSLLRSRHLIPRVLPRLACLLTVPPDRVRWMAASMTARWAEETFAQRELLRDIFGNPFRPAAIDPDWLAWNNGAVIRLACDSYDGRRFDEMPVLGDALEDAGCADESILAHCRTSRLHARMLAARRHPRQDVSFRPNPSPAPPVSPLSESVSICNAGVALVVDQAALPEADEQAGSLLGETDERRTFVEPSVAVVGATGAVGEVMRQVLAERGFAFRAIKFLASERSAGKPLTFKGKSYTVELIRPEAFVGVDIVLSSTPASVSRETSPMAAKAGAIVVDNSSAWRMDPDVPLVVPEVNADALKHIPRGIVANPNCSTIQMVVALKPLHDLARIKRVVVSTYQASSGKGATGLTELDAQLAAIGRGESIPAVTAHKGQLANNVLAHDWKPGDEGYTEEEWKMVHETHKIMGDDRILISPTTVRVPVRVGHSEAVNLEFERPISVEQARAALSKAPGVVVIDDLVGGKIPQPLHCEGRDEVFVGRIRRDPTLPHGLNLWVVSDNLRKGAATNAIQIAEVLVQRGWLPKR